MDNFDISKAGSGDADELIPLNKPVPFDNDDTSDSNVSHTPLDLGGAGTTKAPAEPASSSVKPTTKVPVGKAVSSSDRITGVKTFFTKLHAGSIEFLDGQITEWLRANPGITIKRTNTVTGEIKSKQTEPNIIITVWY
jgi:DNA-binding Lrp family transcriptional regulator